MQNKGSGEGRRAKAGSKAQGFSAIARSGHTNRGRVKQKSHKAANILEVGSVRSDVLFFCHAMSVHLCEAAESTPCQCFL